MIEMLLSAAADIEALTTRGSTPLHCAAENGFVDIVDKLIAAKANVNAVDNEGDSPMSLAAWQGENQVVAALLKAQAKVNPGSNISQSPLWQAVYGGNTECARLLLAEHADLRTKDEGGWDPLLVAAQYPNHEVVDLLLGAGADINSTITNGCTALHIACEYTSVEVVNSLLNAGSNINAVNVDGETPLHFVSWFGHEPIARRLLEKLKDDSTTIPINMRVNDGRTNLWYAISNNRLNIVQILMDAGADPTMGALVDGNNSGNVLHIVVEGGWNVEMLKFFLKERPELINGKNSSEELPIDVARRVSFTAAVELLQEAGSKPGKGEIQVETQDTGEDVDAAEEEEKPDAEDKSETATE
jgi:ankyrin repeat protein